MKKEYRNMNFRALKNTPSRAIARDLIKAATFACTLVLMLAIWALPSYAAEYEDGTYSVSFSMSGLGRHNVAWDTAAVQVEGGKLYVDFTIERIDPRDQAPLYDWLKTEYGTYTPTRNDATYTCTFKKVQIPNLGDVDVTVQTSAMSQPYEVDYTLHIGSEGIPTKPEADEVAGGVAPSQGGAEQSEAEGSSQNDKAAEGAIQGQEGNAVTAGSSQSPEAADGDSGKADDSDIASSSVIPSEATEGSEVEGSNTGNTEGSSQGVDDEGADDTAIPDTQDDKDADSSASEAEQALGADSVGMGGLLPIVIAAIAVVIVAVLLLRRRKK